MSVTNPFPCNLLPTPPPPQSHNLSLRGEDNQVFNIINKVQDHIEIPGTKQVRPK